MLYQQQLEIRCSGKECFYTKGIIFLLAALVSQTKLETILIDLYLRRNGKSSLFV